MHDAKAPLANILICLISGLVLTLAFPKANLHWVAWFTVAPLMYYVYRARWRTMLACAMAFGFGFFISLLHWISVFGTLPWILLAVFQALFILGFAVAARIIGSRIGLWGRLLLLPSLWVTFEWLRAKGLLGFTWGDIGYSQYKVLPLVQLSSITGVWGVSFLLASSNAVLANVAFARRDARRSGAAHGQAVAIAILVGVVFLSGYGALHKSIRGASPAFRAAVVQGNINQDCEQDLEYVERTWRAYAQGSREAASRGAELIVWPETVVPGLIGRDRYLQGEISRMADAFRSHFLVGGWDEDDQGQVYNSAFLVSPGAGMTAKYAKVHLVPFGEFVPWKVLMPLLRYYRVKPYDTTPGPGYDPMDAGGYRLGTAICFESTFPEIARELAASGAQVLCIITYDAWFGRTAAAEQHMAKSVFRAAENNRYLVRGAGTGMSCIIDPHGRILDHADIFRAAVVDAIVRPISRCTFYTRHGDWLVYACLAVVIAFSVSAVIRRKRG